MARIRTIKPAFFSSLSNADLPVSTRLTWIGLWTYVDDKGRAVDDARLVKAAIWPLDEGYTARKVEADLAALEQAGKIGRYEAGGARYLAVVKWREHQRIDKPQKSILPPAPWEEDSGNVPGTLPPNGGATPGTVPPKGGGEVEGKWKGREVEGKGTQQVSSSLDRIAPPPADDDEKSRRANQARSLIADRRIAASTVPIANPRAYRSRVLVDVGAEHDPELLRLAGEGLSVEAIADAVEPPTAPAGPRWPDYAPAEADEPVDQSPEHLAQLRATMAGERSA